jgi:hypothetical protein
LPDDGELEAWQRVTALYGAPDTSDGFNDVRRWTWRRAPGIEVEDSSPDRPFEKDEGPHPTEPEDGTFMTILFGTKPP